MLSAFWVLYQGDVDGFTAKINAALPAVGALQEGLQASAIAGATSAGRLLRCLRVLEQARTRPPRPRCSSPENDMLRCTRLRLRLRAPPALLR
jgi:hypothetical protein